MSPPMNGPTTPIVEEEAGDSKLQAAAKAIAHDEWTRITPGVIKYEALMPITREILESVAMKGLCVGMLAANMPSDHLLASQVPGPISNERGDE